MASFAEELMASFGILIECPNCGTMVVRRDATRGDAGKPGHEEEVRLRCYECGESWTAVRHRLVGGG